MANINIDDSRIYCHINQTIILDFLNKKGFPATTKTLARYSKLGLLMLPKSKRVRETNTNSRTYYCPLAVIEFMTAYMLSSGDYLYIKSDKRIAHYTPQEILAGRIAFFSSNDDLLKARAYEMEEGAFNYLSYSFNLPGEYLNKPGNTVIRYSMKNMDLEYLASMERFLSEFYNSEELGHITLRYVGLIYKVTFQALFTKYIDEILMLNS